MSYSPYKFQPEVAKRVMTKVIPDLKQFMEEHGATHVAVTGSSGIALLALLAAHDIKCIQLRKPEEQSHGNTVEYYDTLIEAAYVFVDDFVSSGKTLNRLVSSLADYAATRNVDLPFKGVYTLRHVVGMAYTNARKVNGVTVPHREWDY